MLHKTRGIILHTIPYSESSIIVKMFTRDFGLQSYIVKGGRSKKSKNKINIFQSLTLVELVVTHSENNKLERISEINIHYPYTSIPYNFIKSSIAIFINEIIYKSLKDGHTDDSAFDFIESSLQILDLNTYSCANFHLMFMLKLSRYYGFYPQGVYCKQTPYFNLQEGSFYTQIPIHAYYLGQRLSMLLNELMNADYQTMHSIDINRTERKQLLDALILFYQLHIESFREIKSQQVLQQILE
jgi:DNA repair protein RecO (recombination protein O)